MNTEIVIVTGLSGAGKSQAKNVLEDLGYYSVDNLPPSMMPEFAELMDSREDIDKVALVVDVRGGQFFDDLDRSLGILEEKGYDVKILYLDASDEVLLKRYKENRRSHPLMSTISGGIEDAIKKERGILSDLMERADHIISTDSTNMNQLRQRIADALELTTGDGFVISLLSFGFKHGLPRDADYVFDLRSLPNPFYAEALRNLTGENQEVRDYVMDSADSKAMFESIRVLLVTAIPLVVKEGRRNVVIAFGCTGGRHRSVTFARLMSEELQDLGYRIKISHRELTDG